MRLWSCFFLVLVCLAQAASGQDDEAQDASKKPVGDVLNLKSGSTMRNVQILRSTPMYYVVEIVKGVEPMEIPRNQVLSVEYDDYDPARERLRRELFPGSEEVTLATGELVSQYLMDKLAGPVSDEPLSYERKDLIAVLEEVAERLDVKIRIDRSLRSTQPNRRKWSIKTTEEMTLMAFLREELVKEFSFVEVLFENDKVLVMTKKAAQSRKAESDSP